MNRIIKTIALVMMTAMLAACVKDPSTDPEPEPTPTPDPFENARFSILGDSYSTFTGHVSPATNDIWPYYYQIGVTSVEQMWWHQMAESLGWTLETNNSFSGSLVCNMNYNNYYGPYSFLNRMDNLGSPNVILVFGGIYDFKDGADLGDYIYWDWTIEELEDFRPALANLFSRLSETYPEAVVIYMADADMGEKFVRSAHTVCDFYGVKCVDLEGIEKDWEHPSAAGMTTIARRMVETIRSMQR